MKKIILPKNLSDTFTKILLSEKGIAAGYKVTSIESDSYKEEKDTCILYNGRIILELSLEV